MIDSRAEIKTQMLDNLADIQHSIWAHWMRYMFSICDLGANGDAIIPKDKVERWRRQMDTPYHQLSEQEKQSDRDVILEFLPQELDMLCEQIDEKKPA